MVKKHTKIQQVYLTLYNLQLIGIHLLIFVDLIQEKFKKDTFNFNNHYQLFLIGTFAQLGDVINAKLGLTSTDFPTALLQIFGRIFVLHLIKRNDELWANPMIFTLLLVYATIELIRYPFYLFKTLNNEVLTLTWLRYNAWLVLYPIGFFCEGYTFYKVVTLFYDSKENMLIHPLGLSIQIDLAAALGFALGLTFPFIVSHLLNHMWQQRRVQNKILAKKLR